MGSVRSLLPAGAWVFLWVAAVGQVDAQTLTWGPDGTGGSGAWDESSTNWWDGASNVTWISGATARFDGAPGTITVSGKPQAAGMVFAGSPFTLQPADADVDILPSQSTFLLDVQNDARRAPSSWTTRRRPGSIGWATPSPSSCSMPRFHALEIHRPQSLSR